MKDSAHWLNLNGTSKVDDPKALTIYKNNCTAIEYEVYIGDATWRQVFTQYSRRTVVGLACQMKCLGSILSTQDFLARR